MSIAMRTGLLRGVSFLQLEISPDKLGAVGGSIYHSPLAGKGPTPLDDTAKHDTRRFLPRTGGHSMFRAPAGCAACERRYNLSLAGSRPSASLWMYNARQQSLLWSLSKANGTRTTF